MVCVDYIAVDVAGVSLGGGIVISCSRELRKNVLVFLKLLSLCDRLGHIHNSANAA
jgi:hypothetical protein